MTARKVLADVLAAHHAAAHLPAVLALLAPHLDDEPHPLAPAVVEVDVVVRLQQLLRWSPDLPAAVLAAVGPWLRHPWAPQPPAPAPPAPRWVAPATAVTPEACPQLSSREHQVLVGIASGKSSVEIGKVLYLTEHTVKTHTRKLFKQLAVHDRAHAVTQGFRYGLLRVNPPGDGS